MFMKFNDCTYTHTYTVLIPSSLYATQVGKGSGPVLTKYAILVFLIASPHMYLCVKSVLSHLWNILSLDSFLFVCTCLEKVVDL